MSPTEHVAGEQYVARWQDAPDDTGRIVCRLCPRYCRIGEGQAGFCFIRQNHGGVLRNLGYGRSTGFCVDPVEKKPLNHFLPGTSILSFGTAGCNLGCRFCQNWSISKAQLDDARSGVFTAEEVADLAVAEGCDAIAFTYNDPVIWAEWAIDCARAAHARGLKTVAVTAGYISHEARAEFYAHMDAANVDLKAFTEGFYRKRTLSHLEPVLETLRWLRRETSVWIEVTTLLIPGENDGADEIARLCEFVAKDLGPDTPLHFTAFHPDFKMLDTAHTPAATLARAREAGLAAGLRYVYVGNVHDRRGQATYCPGCRRAVIGRDWYVIGPYHLDGNRCASCGTTIPGVFASGLGAWHGGRRPVRLGREAVVSKRGE
jgi:pyruvate formate lyase activating enzyme